MVSTIQSWHLTLVLLGGRSVWSKQTKMHHFCLGLAVAYRAAWLGLQLPGYFLTQQSVRQPSRPTLAWAGNIGRTKCPQSICYKQVWQRQQIQLILWKLQVECMWIILFGFIILELKGVCVCMCVSVFQNVSECWIVKACCCCLDVAVFWVQTYHASICA